MSMQLSIALPHSLSELWPILATPGTLLMAGGTDLLVKRRNGHVTGAICCLERIPELRGVETTDETLRIGAATPLADLLRNAELASRLPVLQQAIRQLGSPLIRNQATLGGNLCTASPAGDTLPALHVLGAELELVAEHATRRVPVAQFISGPGRTALLPGEVLAAVHVPLPAPNAVQHFEKVGRRQAMAIAVASLAAMLVLEGNVIRDIQLAFGSVGPTILRCPAAETLLTGQQLCREQLTAAANLVRAAVSPISNVRATADYRRLVAGNLVLRLGNYRS